MAHKQSRPDDETTRSTAPSGVERDPAFGDEAGAFDFPSSNSRNFNSFEPQRLKATIYEDVTVDVLPDPERYLTQNWSYAFANGPGGYPPEWTEVKSSDWHWFRDPNEEWERTIFKNNASVVRLVEQSIANARNEGALHHWSARWSQVVEQHVGAWMHAEHGLGMYVFLPAQRDAPTNMINNAIAVNAIHKLRIAQDLALFNLEVSDVRPDFDGKAHLAAWNKDPIWQPTRETVEWLTSVRDWCQAIVATNLAFEPLVGELFRSGYVMSTAAANGDFVTPTVMGVAEGDFDRDLLYTAELVAGLTHDEHHAAKNQTLLSRWLSEAIAMSLRSAHGLAPIWSKADTSPVTFHDALARACQRLREILVDVDVQAPEELGR